MDYEYFGLLATSILILGLIFVIYKWPQNRHKTFSQHVALRRPSIIYYSSLFLIVLPLLILFFINWFTPTFGLTLWFNAFVLIACAFQIVCTFLPETGGRKTSYHRALAGISAIFLIPAMMLLLITPVIHIAYKFLVALALFLMFSFIYIVIRSRGNPRNFLIIQSSYYAAFLLPIMIISYL